MRLHRSVFLALLAVAGIIPAAALQSQDAQPKPPQQYEYRQDHDPDGIGKFYMGREIAMVITGHGAVQWLDRPEREKEEDPEKLLDALKLKLGDVVADIGAGSGYLSFRISKRVAPTKAQMRKRQNRRSSTGKVLAQDIQQEMLDVIDKRKKQLGASNVQTVLGTITDPKLPPGSCDMEILVDVYHEFDHPYEMTEGMIRGLKVGGRLVFVEYRLEDPNVPMKLVHKMTVDQVQKEMAVFPQLKWAETIETLPWQHIIIFKRVK